MFTSWEQETLARLRPFYPSWDLWIVHLYGGGHVWCGKPVEALTATINTDSPEHLIEEIREQEARSRR